MPGTTDKESDAAAREWQHVIRCFDLDLVDDLYHAKRYRHLRAMAPGNDEAPPDQATLEKSFHRLFIALLCAACLMLGVLWLFDDWRLFRVLPQAPSRIDVALSPAPSQPETEAIAPVENPTPAPTPAPAPEPEFVEQQAAPAVPRAPIDFRTTLEEIIEEKGTAAPKPELAGEDGLRSYLKPFDPKLQEKLDSPWVKKLNRRRVPDNIAATSVGAGAVAKVGNKCYYEAPVTVQPLLTKGWTPTVKEVDCDKMFYDGRITRRDIRKAESGDNPPNQ